jgi:branched-chain amino acid aminotransferase
MSITTPAQLAEETSHLRIWVAATVHTDWSDAHVAATDHGLVVGDGVFEALKVTALGPFAVGRHLDRLTRSARAMSLPDPDHRLIRDAIEAVLKDRRFIDGKVRITYTGGRGPLGSQPAFGPPTLIVAADSRTVANPSAEIVTAPWTRNENGALAGVKSTSYGENVRSLAYATQRGATEAVLLNTAGNICEGTGSNVFCVVGSTIITPPLSDGPLAGITRGLVLEWCRAEELEIVETSLTLTEAQSADEVFLTSSMRDVQAVHRWDDVELSASVGPQTKRVAALFATRSTQTTEP